MMGLVAQIDRRQPGGQGAHIEGGEQAYALQARVARMTRAFTRIAATRMRDVPILHPQLSVEAVGFAGAEQVQGGAGDDAKDDSVRGAAWGILVTPWFMNLIWLPAPRCHDRAMTAPGDSTVRRLGEQEFSFIGADDADIGTYEMCSLFSPMFEFVDQEAARATARQVLAILRPPAPLVPPVAPLPASPNRRAFLLGRNGKRT